MVLWAIGRGLNPRMEHIALCKKRRRCPPPALYLHKPRRGSGTTLGASIAQTCPGKRRSKQPVQKPSCWAPPPNACCCQGRATPHKKVLPECWPHKPEVFAPGRSQMTRPLQESFYWPLTTPKPGPATSPKWMQGGSTWAGGLNIDQPLLDLPKIRSCGEG